MLNNKLLISVIGGHDTDIETSDLAYQVGGMVARLKAILICGGLDGVMEHAARGAKEAGGMTVGILPGADKREANAWIDIPIPTGLGYTRNTLVAGAADIIVALKGREGTLSEIAMALTAKKPVIGIRSWDIPGMIQVDTAAAAEAVIKGLIKE